MEKVRKIRTFCTDGDWDRASLLQICLNDGVLKLAGHEFPFGVAIVPMIDSREEGFQWTRCWLEGSFPPGTSIRIRRYLSDGLDFSENGFSGQLRACLNEKDVRARLSRLRELFGDVISEKTDFLIPGTGRYLWLMLEIGSLKGEDLKVRALHIQMEADHMRDYLPAIYREDDFTYRFLSIFDSMISDLEQRIDSISSELDIDKAGEDMLSYLAGWIQAETERDTDRMRAGLKTALSEYETMYSPEGIRKTIQRLVGQKPILIEGGDPAIYQIIGEDELGKLKSYTDDPYVFFVLLKETAFPTRKSREDFEERMKKYIPAGIEMKLITLKDNVQLGSSAYLGINTALDKYSVAVLEDNAVMRNDTVIGG